MKRWSLDARSKGQPRPLLQIEIERIRKCSLVPPVSHVSHVSGHGPWPLSCEREWQCQALRVLGFERHLFISVAEEIRRRFGEKAQV